MRISQYVAGFAVAAFLAVPNWLYADIIIDDFTSNSDHGVSRTTLGTSFDTQSGIPSANTIGGSRTLELELLSTPVPGSLGADFRVLTAAPFLDFATDGQVGAKGTATWDSNGSGLGGLDLTESGASNAIGVTVAFADNSLELQITVTDSSNMSAITNVSLGAVLSSTEFLYEFDDFANAVNVDFTDVESIELMLTGPFAQDGQISLLRTTSTAVPEPASLALWLIGASTGAAFLRRRRCQQTA